MLIVACLSSVAVAYDEPLPKSKIILPIHPVLIEPDKPKPVVDPTDPTVISEIKPDEMWVIESPIELFRRSWKDRGQKLFVKVGLFRHHQKLIW